MTEFIDETQTEEAGPEFYNRHYIVVDEQNRIVDGWSDGPRPDRDTTGAICINEQGGYQFRLNYYVLDPDAEGELYYLQSEENPALFDWDGMIPLYKWENGEVVKRTAEEIEADRAALPVPEPVKTPEERIAELEEALELLLSGDTGEVADDEA